MSVDKNNLSEAIELLSAGGSNFGPYPEQYYDQYELVFNAAKKYAALEPLLRELCEARGMAFGGEWERDGENIITDKPHSGWCIAKLHEQADCSDGDFIATAANITARIREVVEK